MDKVQNKKEIVSVMYIVLVKISVSVMYILLVQIPDGFLYPVLYTTSANLSTDKPTKQGYNLI
jgi:hypothetical protein